MYVQERVVLARYCYVVGGLPALGMEVSIYTSLYEATVQLRGLSRESSMLFPLILEESQVNRRREAINIAVVGMQSASYPDSNSAWI